MSKFARRVDRNQGEIVEALGHCGYKVWYTFRLGGGFPDILVASKAGHNVLMEIKMPGEDLTPDEKIFHEEWPNRIHVVHDTDEALNVLYGYDHKLASLKK